MSKIIKPFRTNRVFNGDSDVFFVAEKTEFDLTNKETEKLNKELQTTIDTIDSKNALISNYKDSKTAIDNEINQAIQDHTDGILTAEQFEAKIKELKSNKESLIQSVDIELESQLINSLGAKQTKIEAEILEAEKLANKDLVKEKLAEIKVKYPKLIESTKVYENILYDMVQSIVDVRRLDTSVLPNYRNVFDRLEDAIENLEVFLQRLDNTIIKREY